MSNRSCELRSSASRVVVCTLLLASCWLLAGPALAAGGDSGVSNVYVSEPVVPHVLNVDLRDLPRAPAWKPGDPIKVVEERLTNDFGIDPNLEWVDPVRQGSTDGGGFSSSLEVNFEGIPFSGAFPPDVVGDVGPDHYIQAVNASLFAIWDKDGNQLVGTTALNSLWTGDPGSPCTDGDGDPIVQYDILADRWYLSQFDLTGNTFCFFISQGPDPVTDGWFVYEFSSPQFPDYPQYGVWPDAYYVSSFESPSLGIYAFDRAAMLAGAPSSFVRFTIPQLNGTASRVTRILPADVEGDPPPAGAPNYFVRTVDDTQDNSDPTDRLEVWEFDVDFVTPGNSTFNKTLDLIPEPFTLLPCSPGTRDCVPQPGTSLLLDALFNRAMRNLQYRNFGTYETMVVTQVVDAGGGQAGKRWYELRKEGAGDWSIFQQGTYAPDAEGRFMGSIAMDAGGNIALGYSVSSSTVFPGLRATARRPGDAAGTMTMTELSIREGAGIQTATQRWGDYSA
ncbi:MAG: hypothetical protein AAF657_26780, partial [Acidobacteriota bacterium]